MTEPDYWLKNNFISTAESRLLLTTLIHEVSWRQDSIKMFGKRINIPRLQAFMGDEEIEYTYSNLRLKADKWHHDVARIKNRIEELTHHKFNAVLLNYYRDGQDSMGWHRDNEPELGPTPIIASVSLGITRRFLLKDTTQPKQKPFELQLKNGSLLWMGSTLQKNWLHSLPKIRHCKKPRINLTFRYFPD